MPMMNKKIIRRLYVAAIIIILYSIFYNYSIYSSGSLVEARRFVFASPDIKERIGVVSWANPKAFRSSVSVDSESGSASLVLNVGGPRSKSNEFLASVEKTNGVWRIKSATLDGVPVAMTQR
jgi:hypothetical protein